MRHRIRGWSWLAGLTALGVAACSTHKLEPAAGAVEVVGLHNATGISVADVHVAVQARDEAGATDRMDHVMPFYVYVENRSTRPLRLEYRLLKLVTPGGVEWGALPVHEVRGSPFEAEVVAGAQGRIPPLPFPSHRFEVAPHMRQAFRALPVVREPFAAATSYHEQGYAYWRAVNATPTPEMRAAALPEGVLRPEGFVQGYVYFQKPPAHVQDVTFTMNLVDAEDGAIIAVVPLYFRQR
jgi:hypothetical protein